MQRASLGARFGAFMLDMLIISLATGILTMINVVLGFISPWIILFLYYSLFEGSSMGATPGKKAAGICVVRTDGTSFGYGKGFLRGLCRLVSYATCGVGFLIGAFGEDKRCLHDRMAGTIVVRANKLSVSEGVPMRASVLCVVGPCAGKTFPVLPQGVIIGGNPSACNLLLTGVPGVSRMHCIIKYDRTSRTFVLDDLGSSYGTYRANGQRIEPHRPVALVSGEEFYLAQSGGPRFRVLLQ